MSKNEKPAGGTAVNKPADDAETPASDKAKPKEVNGPKGPEPTRYGDWERKGIVSDF